MDCGALSGVPKARLEILGEEREILFYEINELDLCKGYFKKNM